MRAVIIVKFKAFYFILISLLLTCGNVSCVFAQDDFYDKRFHFHDKNRDGILDKHEFFSILNVSHEKAARQKALQRFSGLDTNGDSVLQPEEFRNFYSANTPIGRRRVTAGSSLSKTSKNRQITYTADEAPTEFWGSDHKQQGELSTFTVPFPEEPAKAVYEGMVKRSFALLDLNGDHIVNRQEALKAYASMEGLNKTPEEIRKIVDILFQAMDIDLDERIDLKEFRQNFPESFSF